MTKTLDILGFAPEDRVLIIHAHVRVKLIGYREIRDRLRTTMGTLA